jgi:predicted molibdopterin-dependent oxidoreductase YjgC
MISLTIDGKQFQVEADTTVMEAALQNGIEIPHLCYHPELSASGGCRLCVVEVEGRPKPTPSCELACQEGMAVRTQSDLLTSLRRQVIDLFLSEHPLNCVTCEKAGSCLLQKYAYEFDIQSTSYDFKLSRTLYQDENPFFLRDHQYCILCGRCVRVCAEIVGAHAIDFAGHGYEAYIATPFDDPLADTTCVFCGSCVQVCPTAALMPVSRKGKGREWDLERVRSICSYCGVGCEVEYARRNGEIIYAQARPEAPVNGEFLCTKGRYGWDFVSSPERLTQPLVRRDLAYKIGLTNEPWELPGTSPLEVDTAKIADSFIQVDWDTALDLVSENLAKTVQEHGPDAVMGLSSARCTNEENYLFQKFIRVGIGTNNIDHCARL